MARLERVIKMFGYKIIKTTSTNTYEDEGRIIHYLILLDNGHVVNVDQVFGRNGTRTHYMVNELIFKDICKLVEYLDKLNDQEPESVKKEKYLKINGKKAINNEYFKNLTTGDEYVEYLRRIFYLSKKDLITIRLGSKKDILTLIGRESKEW